MGGRKDLRKSAAYSLAALSCAHERSSQPTFQCARCRDAKWVCERHALSPWPHGDCAYPGKPCPECNHTGETRPEMPLDWVSFAKVEDDE